MEHIELTILGLLVAIAGLAALARVLRVPYPILLVLGGCAIGFVPGIGEVELEPDLVLLIFLPPLLYYAAFSNSPRTLLRDWRAVALLAIGLVAVTTIAVAVVAHELLGLPWSVAFVLGAIVSPTDAVAPSQILRRLDVPRRLQGIVQGENLTNDWTALTLYAIAVAAVTSSDFSLGDSVAKYVTTGVGGVAIGLAAGYGLRLVRRRLDDPPTELTISLFTAYAAYLPAEELGLSGVMAAVTVGLYMGWYTHELTTPALRLELNAVWELVDFLLNALLFVLVGLQLPSVIEAIEDLSAPEFVRDAAVVAAVVVVVRIAWVFLIAQIPPRPPMSHAAVVAWAGQRGAVALAAALALPLATEAGGDFPHRDLLIALTYAVILVTLVGQGLTLPAVIRKLGVRASEAERLEEQEARVAMTEAALAAIDELAWEDWVREDTAERMRGLYEYRRKRFGARAAGGRHDDFEDRSEAFARFTREVLGAQREALIELRNGGAVSDEVRRMLERELDLEEARYSG